MTTIAAFWTPTGAAIGGDRRYRFGQECGVLPLAKVRRVAPWLLVGVAGGGRELRWLRTLSVLDVPTSLDEAIAALDDAAEEWRESAEDDDGESFGNALAVTPWGLLLVASSGHAWALEDGEARLVTIGSGGPYALGAMQYAADAGRRDASKVVHDALVVAARRDAGTGAPFDVLTLDW